MHFLEFSQKVILVSSLLIDTNRIRISKLSSKGSSKGHLLVRLFCRLEQESAFERLKEIIKNDASLQGRWESMLWQDCCRGIIVRISRVHNGRNDSEQTVLSLWSPYDSRLKKRFSKNCLQRERQLFDCEAWLRIWISGACKSCATEARSLAFSMSAGWWIALRSAVSVKAA